MLYWWDGKAQHCKDIHVILHDLTKASDSIRSSSILQWCMKFTNSSAMMSSQVTSFQFVSSKFIIMILHDLAKDFDSIHSFLNSFLLMIHVPGSTITSLYLIFLASLFLHLFTEFELFMLVAFTSSYF